MLSQLAWFNEGDLIAKFEKNGKKITRKLNSDRSYTDRDGKKLIFMGELYFKSKCGHLMTNPATLKDGSEIPEGIMDAFVATLCALHDFKNKKIPELALFIS